MRLLLILLFLLLTPGLVRVLGDVLTELSHDHGLLVKLAVGVVGGGLLFWTVLGRIPGLMTLQHETKHALMALICLRRVRRFVVTMRRGGMVEYSGRTGGAVADHAIGLAPYFLLPLTLMVAASSPLVPSHVVTGAQVAFGAALVVDLLCIRRDLRANFNKDLIPLTDGSAQPSDIGRRGYLFTVTSIAFHGSLLLLLSFALLLWGYHGLPEVALTIGRTWLDHLSTIVGLLQSLETNGGISAPFTSGWE